jgi:hypothetical protein
MIGLKGKQNLLNSKDNGAKFDFLLTLIPKETELFYFYAGMIF